MGRESKEDDVAGGLLDDREERGGICLPLTTSRTDLGSVKTSSINSVGSCWSMSHGRVHGRLMSGRRRGAWSAPSSIASRVGRGSLR